MFMTLILLHIACLTAVTTTTISRSTSTSDEPYSKHLQGLQFFLPLGSGAARPGEAPQFPKMCQKYVVSSCFIMFHPSEIPLFHHGFQMSTMVMYGDNM
jgi:hypothetical protein